MKDPFKLKYQLLIKVKRKSRDKITKKYKGIHQFFTNNLEDYNPTRKEKVLIGLDDMIVDIEASKKQFP